MSGENVRTVVDSAAALSRGDDAWSEYWADDLDYRTVEGANDPGPIHGKAALLAYIQDWTDTFDQLTVESLEVVDAGPDQVVAVFRTSGRAKLSGVETDLTYATLHTFRDGKIARAHEYRTREEALAAAGLRE